MNNIIIKKPDELVLLRKSGKILAKVFEMVEKYAIFPGSNGLQVEKIAQKYIKKFNVKPAFLDFEGYPAITCVSINHQLVHTPPSKQIFKEGDIVSVDMGVINKNYYSDKAITYPVGKISSQRQKLINTAKEALEAGIKAAKPNNQLGDISFAIQKTIEKYHFSIIRELAGHGVGKELHEPPTIFNYGTPHTGPILKPGMVFALEPMLSAGSSKIKIANDGWAIIMKDGSDSSHFEDTIAITEKGANILTR